MEERIIESERERILKQKQTQQEERLAKVIETYIIYIQDTSQSNELIRAPLISVQDTLVSQSVLIVSCRLCCFLQEMRRLKLEQQKDERMRQQIKENSLELRELEARLKAGYMNKERAAQLAEKKALKTKDEVRTRDIGTSS